MGTTVTNSHRIAVVSKYLGPTNHRGSRIKVRRGDHTTGDKILTVSWQYELGIEENHAAAIRAYLEMMGWEGEWVVGATTEGYVAVMAGKS